MENLDLTISTDDAIDALVADLRARVAEARAEGLIFGLSGGLDSAVLAALAVRAVGPAGCTAVYMGDRVSEPELDRKARRVAEALGLDLERRDITADLVGTGVYRPLFLRLLQVSPLVARLSSASYWRICRENPFRSSLRAGGGERLRPWYKRLLFDFSMRQVDAGFRVRHIFRRTLLEEMAASRNLLPVGAANRSECEVGWFVKDGIDDLPYQPMTGLLKTQLRQLAVALDIPPDIVAQKPSPDMARGVTDEFGIGHDYAVIDTVIDALDRGLSEDAIAGLGIAPAEVEDIRALMRLSAWKRGPVRILPPVDGRFGSPIRARGARRLPAGAATASS
ncbi:NAD(+) synthase [Jannaschia ovalis]|uniref:NH(3)-dependent NAD(+) synthetase n=1 Tax=Jannaschia ovalis TaxID=3038773 RepID=A0ABY8LBV5_9RHOB|nr:NAD(+) synthase [Jannaschia sp. GRR-S6-38]WGH78771.1 NAD(+) synthase [Jannaschia sp. GRR-S6-38]